MNVFVQMSYLQNLEILILTRLKMKTCWNLKTFKIDMMD